MVCRGRLRSQAKPVLYGLRVGLASLDPLEGRAGGRTISPVFPPGRLSIGCGALFEATHCVAIQGDSFTFCCSLKPISKVAGDANGQTSLRSTTLRHRPEILLDEVIGMPF